MKSAIEMIAEERRRQIEKEGYNADHDHHHEFDELAYAAIAYTLPNPIFNVPLDEDTGVSMTISKFGFWPFHRSEFNPSGNRVKDLVKAGALIAAEIDRLNSIK